MRKLLLALLIMPAFNLFAQQDSIVPEQITYEYFTGKTIGIVVNENSFYPDMKDGDKVVFQYTRSVAQNTAIADDEMYESVIFEADTAWKSFVYRKKLSLSKATYNLGCFCIGRGYHKITGGYIKGKKLANGNYFIEADLEFKYSTGVKKRIRFKGEFRAPNAG